MPPEHPCELQAIVLSIGAYKGYMYFDSGNIFMLHALILVQVKKS